MASVSRSKQFSEVHKVLKRHYKPVKPDFDRPVLEHLLLACCLENAHYEPAEETFAAMVHTFFDFNEIRVTSIRELSEVMTRLPDPQAAANRFKRVLQGVFEATYSFDLEERRKKNLGPTVKWLKQIDGTTNFSVSYVVQSALGGHAIPIDLGVLGALRVVELVSDEDVEAGLVPGLERAISKAKGIEFGSLLHQLGADFTANPYSPPLREILLEINADAADRLPKRRAAKTTQKKTARKKASAEPPGAAQAKPSPGAQKKASAGEQRASAPKRASAAAEKASSPVKKKPAATKKKTSSSQRKATAANTPHQTSAKKKKSTSEQLSKRKPR